MKHIIATLILLVACASVSARPAYIYRKVGNRVMVLIVKRETAERLRQNRLTEADREELKAAEHVALGVSDSQGKRVCIGHDPPHDRWLRCPAQNIR